MKYDSNNIFAKIIRGEIETEKIAENDTAIAIRDIQPQRKVHILIIPKGEYRDFYDLATKGQDQEVLGLVKLAAEMIAQEGLQEQGYRMIMNSGEHGHQEVPHLHIHLIGGEATGPLLTQRHQ